MYKRKLVCDADFDNAVFLGVNIEVWHGSELIDKGPITKNHPAAVYIRDGYYLKQNFEFRM